MLNAKYEKNTIGNGNKYVILKMPTSKRFASRVGIIQYDATSAKMNIYPFKT